MSSQEDKEIEEIEKEEKEIERTLFKLGDFTIKRSHLLELTRGTAGAFLGVGLGQALGGSLKLAKNLPWENVIGILIFIFILVGLLIYKNDKSFIKGNRAEPVEYVLKKITVLYSISLCVEVLGLVLFNDFPGWNTLLVKALLVGSYPAMSSAAAFSII
ncbi:MAG TPA: hypothetical protein VFP35_00930 [Candidatus Saccharimonadales bacterium]|nr:hypothetical protein [Candidatus Saccharimonadales bacterium]